MSRRLRDVLPLSPLQEGMLFHTRYDSAGADVYTVALILDLEGTIDADALRRAGDALLARHPNLGAAFRHRKSGEPVQLISEPVPWPLRERDVTGLPEQQRQPAVDRLIDEDRATRFDVGRPPLVRTTLVRYGPAAYRLVLTLHHLVADGWSMPILARELFTLYGGGAAAAQLPAVTPYREYLRWLSSQDRTAAREAWAAALHGLSEATLLGPADHRGPALLPAQITAELGQADTARLTGWTRARGLTLNSAVQGAWAVLLGALTGRADVTFGMVTSGRPAEVPGIETMVGFFINTLPVRVRLDPGASLEQTIGDLQRQQIRLMPHGHLGLGELQSLAGLGALCDTALVFENYPLPAAGSVELAPGLKLVDAQGRDSNHYALSLLVVPGDRLALRLDYRPDLFDAATAIRIVDRLCELLRRTAERAGEPLARIDVLDARERHDVLVTRNDTRHELPPATLPALIEAQVARGPLAPAVSHAGNTVTHFELDRRANRLARYLIGRGVGPGQLVAVALPPSDDLLVTLLAVLKAGAGYVPLDPRHPADRIGYVLADSAARLLITTTAEAIPAAGAAVVNLDDDGVRAAVAIQHDRAPDDADRTAPLLPRHPAYVIYTSGSTGRPKGVLVEHESAVNYVRYAAHAYLGVSGTAVLHSPVTFDLTVTTLFAPLVSGGHIVVSDLTAAAAPGQRSAPECTFLKATPSHIPLLDDVSDRYSPAGDLVVGGEQLLGEGLRLWRQRHPGATVVNEYGPTEATVGCVVYSLAPGASTPSGAIPIGRPIWNAAVYVLDSMLRPVPDGVVGELYLSGTILARGYVNRAALTAQRFVADPFAESGRRMYRTGDLARWSGTGELEYLGRTDGQVKVRGYRIELGEIEATLVAHPAVEQAAVGVHTDGDGESRIVAYVVPDAAVRDGGTALLRKHVAAALPEYMLPNLYVGLGALPLTGNGKLDRAALARPERERSAGTPPRTEQESELCLLFAQTLGLERVGIDDDFFDLGGQSMLAMRLAARIRAQYGVDLPIRALFEAPTVAELAERLTELGELSETDSFATLIPLRRTGGRPPIFCMHPGGGVSWFYRGLTAQLGPDYPLYGLQARGILEPAALPTSLAAMAAEYIREIRQVWPDGPYHLLGWSFGGVLAYEVAVQLQGQGARVGLLASLDGTPAGPDEPLSDDRQLLAQILTYLGYDPAELLAGPIALADLVRRFRRDENLMSSVTEQQLANLLTVARNNSALRRDYQPGRYAGTLLFFQATGVDATVPPSDGSWGRYVDGTVARHEVACAHDFMLTARPLGQIGRAVFAELSQIQHEPGGSR
jgi:amino acid adenylation domain-containing protein